MSSRLPSNLDAAASKSWLTLVSAIVECGPDLGAVGSWRHLIGDAA